MPDSKGVSRAAPKAVRVRDRVVSPDWFSGGETAVAETAVAETAVAETAVAETARAEDKVAEPGRRARLSAATDDSGIFRYLRSLIRRRRRGPRRSNAGMSEKGALTESGQGVSAKSSREEPTRQSHGRHDNERYRREMLRVAREILERADREVSRWIVSLRERKNFQDERFDDSRFYASISALNDRALWLRFLERGGLADNEAARTAVEGLSEHVANIKARQVLGNEEDSLQLIQDSIQVLLAKINDLDAKSVSRERAEHLKATAEWIGWQVAAAGAAIGANAAASGTDLTEQIILAGVSSSVAAAVVGALHDWQSRKSLKDKISDRALLHRVNDDLLNQMNVLALFISRRAEHEPEDADEDRLVRSAYVQVRFAVMYATQLVAGIDRLPGGNGYPNALSAAKKLIAKLENCIEVHDCGNALKLNVEMKGACARLRRYRAYVAAI